MCLLQDLLPPRKKRSYAIGRILIRSHLLKQKDLRNALSTDVSLIVDCIARF